MTALNQVLWGTSPVIRAEPGIKLADLNARTRSDGWKLRIHPSTKRTATLGGFVGGGHAGIGSYVYGVLRDRGNSVGLEVMSDYETPRIVELRGAEVNLVHNAYGTSGLITAIEMPLAPAWSWTEAITFFPEFMTAIRFARARATSDGLIKKLISIDGWPLPSVMRPLAPLIRADEQMVLCMIAPLFEEMFLILVAEFGGIVTTLCGEGEGRYGELIYEFAWGHARLHVNKTDRSIVSGVGLYAAGNDLGAIGRSYRRFGDLGPMHFEVRRFDGALSMQGSPFFPFIDDNHLAGMLRGTAEDDVMVANHTFRVKEGGMKSVDAADLRFKRSMDPHGLLNPGKRDAGGKRQSESAGAVLPADGWTYQQQGAGNATS